MERLRLCRFSWTDSAEECSAQPPVGDISAQSQALVSSGARDLQQTPRANCVVSYRKNETKVSPLDGKVACELSKHLYGVDQWWVLLKKKT